MSTNTVRIADGLAPQLVSFRQPRFMFILHNARRKPIERMTLENLITIPAVNVIGPKPGLDADKDPIPGTYVVEDHFYKHEDGSEELIFSAVKSVQLMLGIQAGPNGEGGVATSPVAISGLSLLPHTPPPTKEQWKAAASDGEKRSFLVDVKNAQDFVESIRSRNGKWKASGMEAPPLGLQESRDWNKAVAFLKEYNRLLKLDAEEFIAPHREDEVAAEAELELELEAHLRAVTMSLAEKQAAKTGVDKMKLFNELMNDAEFRVKVQKTHKIQKRGHKPVPAQELEDAAAAGLSVKEAGLEDDLAGE